MKLLFSLLALVLTTKECENKNSSNESNKTEIVNSDKLNDQQKEYTIEYSAISRGIFREITINNSVITVKNDRNSKPVTKECTNEIWSKLTKTLDELDLKMLPELKAPTQKRLFDGAAHATLKVIVDGGTYTTSSFDHGFPPEDIRELCDKLMEISVDTNLLGNYKVIFVAEIEGEDIADKNITISFNEDGKVNGNNSCNNYDGNYNVDKNKLSFGMMKSTRKFCQENAEIETTFMRNLTEIDSFKIHKDVLILLRGETHIIEAKKVLEKE